MTFVAVCRNATERNAALAECTEEWIAYRDPDVVAEPTWRVPEVADDVAVVAGPLTGAFGTHHESSATFHSGNVALRAAALRGVGGFWPARGHEHGRDWFSDEHEAQRELFRAGWKKAWAPEMAARRTPSARLRRAARFGARRQIVGEPRSMAELLRLAARGRPALIAEAVGGLLGQRLAGGDFEPAADHTPFRASVPVPRPQAPTPPGTVLLYHRIVDRPDDPLGLCVSPAHFAEHAEILRSLEVVPLDAMGPGQIAITFDDGYADNLRAAELLGDLPATLFVSTGHVDEGRPFWWDEVRRALAAGTGPLRLRDRAWPGRSAIERRYLGAWLQGLPPAEIEALLAELLAWAGVERGPGPADRPLTIEELRTLPWTLGAHTRDHPSLRALPPDERRVQIERSRDDLAAWMGKPPTAFSYPFGAPGGDFDRITERLVREAGFTRAVTTSPTGPGARQTVPDVGGAEFERWLSSRPSAAPRAPR